MENRKSTYGTLFIAVIGLAACRGDDDPSPPPLTGGGGPTIGGISTGGGSTSAADSSGGEGDGAGGEVSSSEPVCEQHLTFSCRGYRIGQYVNGTASTWNPTSDGATIQCLDLNEVEVCAPSTGAIDLQDPDDPMVQEILMRCEDACDLMPVEEESLPFLVADVWMRINAACVFEADPVDDNTAPAGFGGFTHTCGSVTSVNPQIQPTGDCDGGQGDPTECPIGSECGSWRPERYVYASRSQSIIDVDFFDALDIGTMFACDSPSFVYSSDGTGTSFIDGLVRGEMLYELGLRDGMFDFEIRKSGGSWYPLNTYAEMLTAFSSLDGVTDFELRYYRAGATKKTVTTVEVKQCGKGCDHLDL